MDLMYPIVIKNTKAKMETVSSVFFSRACLRCLQKANENVAMFYLKLWRQIKIHTWNWLFIKSNLLCVELQNFMNSSEFQLKKLRYLI